MPDGKRKRRYSKIALKRRWYAAFRSWRHLQRYGLVVIQFDPRKLMS